MVSTNCAWHNTICSGLLGGRNQSDIKIVRNLIQAASVSQKLDLDYSMPSVVGVLAYFRNKTADHGSVLMRLFNESMCHRLPTALFYQNGQKVRLNYRVVHFGAPRYYRPGTSLQQWHSTPQQYTMYTQPLNSSPMAT